jgi:nitrate reductase gamma subunit
MTTNVIADVAVRWSSYYDKHQAVSVLIRFLHLAAIVLGAGSALITDRRVLGASLRKSVNRDEVFATLRPDHLRVAVCMIVLGITGILMTAADSSTYFASKIFWVKMTLVALLLSNGAAIVLAERRIGRVGVAIGWRRLAITAGVSVLLWLTILYMGVLLTVAA